MDFFRLKGNRASRLVDPQIDQLARAARSMTEFDHYTASLCESTHRDRGSIDETLHFGMIAVLKDAVSIALAQPDEARGLLHSKAAVGSDDDAWVSDISVLAGVIAAPETWHEIQENSNEEGFPSIVTVITILVSMFEQRYPRPVGRAFAGFYALCTDYVFGIGLHLGLNYSAVAIHLRDEPYMDSLAVQDAFDQMDEES